MKAIINNIPAFDATKGTTGSFITNTYITGYKLIITDMSGVNAYDGDIIPDYSNEFTIPANTLKNNSTYFLRVVTYEEYGDIKKEYTSDPVTIMCFPKPETFKLSIDFGSGKYKLRNTMLELGVDYIQGDSDKLDFYYIVVTDNIGNEIYKSENIYNIEEYVQINNLIDGSNYDVCGYGKTINGMSIYTEIVTITTNFVMNETFTMLKANNNRLDACVDIETTIKNVLYRLDKDPESYSVDANGITSLDLTDNTLEYYDGFMLYDNFSLFLECEPDILQDHIILNLNGGEIVLVYDHNEKGLPYFEFRYNGKILVINRNKEGKEFTVLDRIFQIIIYRDGGEIQIKINNKA